MTISINQLVGGMGLKIDGNIFLVTEYNHVKPGKGSAFVRVKLKNVKTQQVLEKTYKTADKLEDVPLEEKKLQNLYKSSDGYHFMDLTSFEQLVIPTEVIGSDEKYLQENAEVVGICHHNEVLKIKFPIFIEFEIIEAEPGLKGDSSKAGNKPAKIDTGATIQVPLFIVAGDRVKVDTRTGEYVERVKQ